MSDPVGFYNPSVQISQNNPAPSAPPPSQKAQFKGVDTQATTGEKMVAGHSKPSEENPTERVQVQDRHTQIVEPEDNYTIRVEQKGKQPKTVTVTPEIKEKASALSERLSEKYNQSLVLTSAEWDSVDEDIQQKPTKTYSLRASRGEEEPERKRDVSLETQKRQLALDNEVSNSVGQTVKLYHASWEADIKTLSGRFEKTTEKEANTTIQRDHQAIIDKAKAQIQEARVELENEQKRLFTMSHGDISTVNRQTEETPVDDEAPASLKKTIHSPKSTDRQSHDFGKLREHAEQQVKEGNAELKKLKEELQALKGTGGADVYKRQH